MERRENNPVVFKAVLYEPRAGRRDMSETPVLVSTDGGDVTFRPRDAPVAETRRVPLEDRAFVLDAWEVVFGDRSLSFHRKGSFRKVLAAIRAPREILDALA